MTRDEQIFSEVVDLPPNERQVLLEHMCNGDAVLRADVEELIAAHERAGTFLEQMAVARPELPPDEKPGDRIGRYTLLEKIGEGGFGRVYLAEQKEPVRRRVALKIIKLGMDTRAVMARFEAERQALAMMDHPGIARVYDAGATETGRPFFVMELVEGTPIGKFCHEHRLSIPARLELFARVCLALQHAHQKGIVHRDIKPSNILVAMHDGVPSPKVIDFGIAKATQERLTEETLVTGVDQFMGTPSYMSPEQADRRDLDIDTRSDIYALGVLLYELLAGRLPFDPQTLANLGLDGVRRIICEVEPPRPSARVAALAPGDREAVAHDRGLAPGALVSTLRGDLDWIVGRCLEKNRDRRYGSAQELADDVRRHLAHEPVEARPPSTAYRMEKFVARHRLACASVAAIALTLIAGTVVSVRQAVRATRAEHVATDARDQARQERDAAVVARQAETVARTDAQRRQEEAEGLLTFMLGDFRTELQKIGRLKLLDQVGDKAMAYFAELNPRDLTDTALARQAKALTQIGEIRMDQARYNDAQVTFTTAYDRAAALAARHPKNGDVLFERAQAEYWLGYVADRRGDLATERKWYTRYRASALALGEIEGQTPRAQLERIYGYHNMAALEFLEANYAEARRGFVDEQKATEELLLTKPGDPQLKFNLADVASWLGFIADRSGDYREALTDFREMLGRVEDLAEREPTVAMWQLKLADSRSFIGYTLALTGRTEEAEANFAEAQAIVDRLVARDPKNRTWQKQALMIRLRKIEFLRQDGRNVLPDIVELREKFETLVSAEPSASIPRRCLAATWRLEAQACFATAPDEADAAIRHALDLLAPLLESTRIDDFVFWEFGESCIWAGRMAESRGQHAAALRCWQRVVDVLGSQAEASNNWRLLDPVAQALVLSGKSAAAGPLAQRLRRFGYRAPDSSAVLPLSTSHP